MGREECIHLVLDYNLDLAYARNLAGATPLQAARSTGQVRLVKAIQQRLQVRSNEANPPTQIMSTPVSELASDDKQYRIQCWGAGGGGGTRGGWSYGAEGGGGGYVEAKVKGLTSGTTLIIRVGEGG